MTLFISNLSFKANEADLSSLLLQEGFAAAKCKIIKDRVTGQSRGFALVDLIDPSDDDRAIRDLQGIRLFGRELKVKKDERSSYPISPGEQRQTRQGHPERQNQSPMRQQQDAGLPQRRIITRQKRGRDCDAVPMEYRAQVEGRCQRQYFQSKINCRGKAAPAITHWIDEWAAASDKECPFDHGKSRTLHAHINWRLLANSGLDEGMIRPVIAAGAWPIIPGSSIKGLFRKACNDDKLVRWCGTTSQSGILRFLGAWPSDPSWKNSLLDLTHAQESWQLGMDEGGHSANVLVSLHQPSLTIAFSSRDDSLDDKEWKEIEETLQRALAMGIGGRTSSGYGNCGNAARDPLFSCCIEGRFPTAKLLDRRTEFRPTMFRAAIRGMALRLFAGVTTEQLAKEATENLFGALQSTVSGKPKDGLLAMTFELFDESQETGRVNDQEFCSVAGNLRWHRARPYQCGEDHEKLIAVLAALHGLVISLGGFGRSWRRPDHGFFHRNYATKLIGCHWQWRTTNDPYDWIDIGSAEQLGLLLAQSREVAREWLRQTNCLQDGNPPNWREVIDPSRMLVWSRIASSHKDAKAIYWFHERPAHSTKRWANRSATALFRTDLAGRVINKHLDEQNTLVGSLWNRMLPIIDADYPRNSAPQLSLHQGRYLEILVVFDHHKIRRNADFQSFVAYLRSGQSDFKPVVYS